METKEIIRSIREKNNLTQEQFAERIHVTRQAVSRWENGETLPDTIYQYTARLTSDLVLPMLRNAVVG